MEPLERAAVLLTLVQALLDVMKRENALLRSMQLGRLADLQQEKAALAEAYELELARLRQAPEVIASLPDYVRGQLELAMRDLHRAMRVNIEALRAGREVIEGVVRRIGSCLAAADDRRQAYGRGTVGEAASGHIIPIALDRRI
jgi:hypothetical protein